jgi:hypothetical protein
MLLSGILCLFLPFFPLEYADFTTVAVHAPLYLLVYTADFYSSKAIAK